MGESIFQEGGWPGWAAPPTCHWCPPRRRWRRCIRAGAPAPCCPSTLFATCRLKRCLESAQWRENCNTIFLLMKQSGLSLIYTGTLGVWHANIHPGTRVPMLKACLSIYTFCQHFSPSTYPSTLATSENFLQAAKKCSYCQINSFPPVKHLEIIPLPSPASARV